MHRMKFEHIVCSKKLKSPIGQTLTRLENLSHILGQMSMIKRLHRFGKGCPKVDGIVELPRLKLAFTSREDHAGNINLYSIDHADLYITNKRPHMIGKILEGIPHSLVMSNSQHELSVLAAVLSPVDSL